MPQHRKVARLPLTIRRQTRALSYLRKAAEELFLAQDPASITVNVFAQKLQDQINLRREMGHE